MVEPSRPVAPYLPPEIISRILQFFHPPPTASSNRSEEEPEEHLDFSPISRINMSWSFEAQKRLLQVIYIKSTTKLRRLVDIKKTDLMKHILCLNITLPDRDNFNPDSIFHLIQFSTNLKTMNLILPSTFNFTPTQIDTMKRNDLLPHLLNLKIYFYPNTSNNNKINIVDSILSTSPSLATLMFQSGVTGSAFVYGLRNFKSLSLLSTLEIGNTLTEELMESLPTSISHLKAGGLAEHLPFSEWSTFSNLKVLQLQNLPDTFHISQLPKLSSLRILRAETEAILQSLELIWKE